jgi:serine/threonine-protein kinase RsbT
MSSERGSDPRLAHAPAMAIAIASATDIVTARQRGRELAAKLGFSGSEQTVVATAISELARNILEYARTGQIEVGVAHRGSRIGLVVVALDAGPGIADISRAMQDGYSTGHGLGLGLPGVKRLMDEFSIVSAPGEGTCVTVRKWTI